MKTVCVHLGDRSYPIIIGDKAIAGIGRHLKRLAIGDAAYIVSNRTVKSRFAKALERSLAGAGISHGYALVADSERSKSLVVASQVLNGLARFARHRQVFVIALGGGVIGDLAGFVASVFRRGIPYVQVPTTLLAQVDSAIGGKTAVDLPEAKNLVGSFYQPRAVYSDVATLKTLSARQLKAGLAEAIKYGLILDPGLFCFLEENINKIVQANTGALLFVVERCSRLKAVIVAQDEREAKSIRTVLNFGHTIGHAIEAAGRFRRYNHGESVALGMLCALDISSGLGLSAPSINRRLESLLTQAGFDTTIKNIARRDIFNALWYDKKFQGSVNRFVLLRKIGCAAIVKNIPAALIRSVLARRS